MMSYSWFPDKQHKLNGLNSWHSPLHLGRRLVTTRGRRWLASLAAWHRHGLKKSPKTDCLPQLLLHLLVCLRSPVPNLLSASNSYADSLVYPYTMYSTRSIHGLASSHLCSQPSEPWNTVDASWGMNGDKISEHSKSSGKIFWHRRMWLGYPAFRIVIHLLLHCWHLTNSCEAACGWLRNLHLDMLPSTRNSW